MRARAGREEGAIGVGGGRENEEVVGACCGWWWVGA